MTTAYTPGLTVTASTTISKTRRLPIKGEVLCSVGEVVEPDTIVAKAELPGIMQTVRVAEQLAVEPDEAQRALRVKVGDTVERGSVIAETKSLFGLMTNRVASPIDGTVETISSATGHVGIRHKPIPVEVNAYVHGTVSDVMPQEGVVIETVGALIQGIFGVGGERLGEIRVLADSPDDVVDEQSLGEDLARKVIICGANITGDALRKAGEIGVAGVVVGGIIDRDMVEYLGFDIGVAITGQEQVPATLIVTEGFGAIRMALRTFDLLKSLEGKLASINGATQIRAGVIRPEIIVPNPAGTKIRSSEQAVQTLEVGAPVRIIREPHFGKLGQVVALPSEPVVIESGAKVRTLQAKLEDGTTVSVPRANVEIIQE